MRHVCGIVGLLFIGLLDVPSLQRAKEGEERARRPASSHDILATTAAFEQAVNGKAIVRNRCRVQGIDVEVEEKVEVIAKDGCKLIVRARKVTRAVDAQAAGRPAEEEKKSSTGQEESAEQPHVVDFVVYADLSELTTPVLVETEKFARCEAGSAGALKVSSRSELGKTMQVIRRSKSSGLTQESQEVKQTRHDLSLFFSAPAAAEKARKALERTVKACGGKEWPEEDDLP